MNVGQFLSNELERLSFIINVNRLFDKSIYREGHEVATLECVEKLSPKSVYEKSTCRSYDSLLKYEQDMIHALEIVLKNYNTNLINENIVSIEFRCLEHACDPNDLFFDNKIQMMIDDKVLCIYKILHIFPQDDTVFEDEVVESYGTFAHRIFYDGELIYVKHNCNDFIELKNENAKLKRELIFERLSKFLPGDIVYIIISFDLF